MVAFNVGSPSVSRNPSGFAAAFAFGAPSIGLSVSVTGFACACVAGSVPLITPAGKAQGVGFGGVPVAIPAGKAQGVGFGSAPVAIPSGHAATFSAGNTDAAIPGGMGCGVGFGAPTVVVSAPAAGQIDINASGLGCGTAFGGVPTVAPGGFTAGFGANVAPIAVPHGFAAAVAIGTPTIVLGRAVGVAGIPGGLALARWHYDELIAEWYRLKKIREDLEARQERLVREKKAVKRARQRAVVDITAEHRLDEMIIACNRAYAMLQEREDEVYAGVRAQLADVEAISSENKRVLRSIEETYSAMLQADDEDAILALM